MFCNLVLAAITTATLAVASIGSSTSANANDWAHERYNRQTQHYPPAYNPPAYYAYQQHRPLFTHRPHARQIHYGFGYSYSYNRPWVQHGW